MSRLAHSFPAYLRAMQMSSVQLFVFVEGKRIDPFFYGSVCLTVPKAASRYELRHAAHLSADGGGKEVLLDFFTYLRSKGQLMGLFKGKKTAAIFYLDKDLDDMHRTRKRSAHVVYTEYYDVQNHVFEHGDLVRGVAAAASVDPDALVFALRDACAWCKLSARRWREWIALCVCASELDIKCQANYRVTSRVQTRPSGPLDAGAHAQVVREAAGKAGVSTLEFQRRLDEVSRRVDRILKENGHHRVFKGKWFAAILADELDVLMAGRPFDGRGLAGRITQAVAATLDFDQSWADRFRKPLAGIAVQL